MDTKFKDNNIYQIINFSLNTNEETTIAFHRHMVINLEKSISNLHKNQIRIINSLYTDYLMRIKRIEFLKDNCSSYEEYKEEINRGKDECIKKAEILSAIQFKPEKFSIKPDKNGERILPFKHNRILTGLSIFKDIKVSKCDAVMIVQKFIAGNVGGYFNE